MIVDVSPCFRSSLIAQLNKESGQRKESAQPISEQNRRLQSHEATIVESAQRTHILRTELEQRNNSSKPTTKSAQTLLYALKAFIRCSALFSLWT